MPMSVPYQDLENKNVLITGGASGLGHAMASAFAAHQAHVVIVGRDSDKLMRAQRELGENVRVVAFDLGKIDKLPELMMQIAEVAGPIDILINNAGINSKKEAWHVSNREYQDIIQTNQTAVFALTREIAKSMATSGCSIFMISSMAAHYCIPQVISYTASKSAVEGMTRALAVEWAAHGIRVNCIAPGFITTPMSSRALDEDPKRKKRVLARTPMGKLGEPEDVANAALFLASTQAKYITGVVLPVDGGNAIGF